MENGSGCGSSVIRTRRYGSGAPIPGHPRDYNFAADILESNLAAGRADKAAFIDANGSWSYGQLADRAARFGAMLRAKGIRREERILICLLDTIDWPTAFLGALKAGVVAIPGQHADDRERLRIHAEPTAAHACWWCRRRCIRNLPP